MNEKFLKPYDSLETEARIYDTWEKSGYFNPDKLPADKPGRGAHGEPFSIVLPPPNVTGTLHTGHALTTTIEDIMVRYARMKGKKTLWLPGTDHAAIATQSKVEKELEKNEGKRRRDLGREEFLKRVDDFAQKSHDTIVGQLRKMGASIDWSREAFTLDEKRNLAVRTAFKKMYDDSLIYRGFRVVNWDPKGQTTISDDEIVYEARKTKLYTFKYSKDIPITISTTRPETKLGDTAIAVHPDDERYKKFVGKEFDAVFAGEPIHLKVIADIAVEKDFGTGALGVTPAHSQIDWEMGQKHVLPLKQVIDEFARMTVGNENVKGKKVAEAREAVVAWLKSEGLLEKEEDIEHNIALAERTGGIIEPLPKLQWFIDVNKQFERNGKPETLKSLMMSAITENKINIVPDRFAAVYINWIGNLRPWCISRQIWYGHRIPVWYKNNKVNGEGSETATEGPLGADSAESCLARRGVRMRMLGASARLIEDFRAKRENPNEWTAPVKESETRREHEATACPDGGVSLPEQDIYVGLEAPKGEGWTQDEDTLDTWFSSGLWTFSTLGWPDEKEFAKHREFHPTTILETGYDILFFWVARMILMSTYLLGEVPFKNVYLHGLVRDSKGRKMSKSLGNVMDPLDLISKYGADALRMALVVGVGPGNDSKLDEQKIKAYKLFSNKLWNVARFVLSTADGERGKDQPKAEPIAFDPAFTKWTAADLAHKKDLDDLVAEITKEMDEYKFYLVSEKLYHYVWHTFADKILEESKAVLAGAGSESRIQLLLLILGTMLKALHPFMPYITEEIWGDMEKNSGGEAKSLLMVEKWPMSR